MKLFKRTLVFIALFIFLTAPASAQSQNSMYQISTINALMQGVYDGDFTVKDLKQHGNFGIGTLNHLDGEMIALDGNFYQVKSMGEIKVLSGEAKTPFANVVNFRADKVGQIKTVGNFSELEKALDSIIQDKNYIYAIRIEGIFTGKTRSIGAQSKPYPSLSAAAKKQVVFDIINTKGTVVGFWCPEYVSGINVKGYHLHFISDDRKSGGHILSCGIEDGKVQVSRISDFRMVLPSGTAFQAAELNKDYSKELAEVEKSK